MQPRDGPNSRGSNYNSKWCWGEEGLETSRVWELHGKQLGRELTGKDGIS